MHQIEIVVAAATPTLAAATWHLVASRISSPSPLASFLPWPVACPMSRSRTKAPLDILREQPDLLLELLRLAGDPTTDDDSLRATIGGASLTDAVPSVLNADLVSLILDDRGAKRRVVVVEVQREKRDEKFPAWAQYLAYLSAHEKVPVTLLVIALDRAVAEWARTPRPLGPSLSVTPLVIGPDDLPELRADWAANLPLAMLTAVARLESPSPGARGESERAEVLRVFEGVARLDDERLRHFCLNLIHGTARGDFTEGESNSKLARLVLRRVLRLVHHPEPSEFRATLDKVLEAYGMSALQLIFNEGKAEGMVAGEAKGKADTLLRQLRLRGFEVDHATVQRIHEVTDGTQLDAWLDRVLGASRLEDVFA